MITSILKPLFRQYVNDTESPQETLKRLNADFLTLTEEADFLTAFVGIFDPHTCQLRYANAGHPPPFCLRKITASIDILRATGTLLGVFNSEEWVVEERVCQVAPGDQLWLITDGICEARSKAGVSFGMAGLENVVRDVATSGFKNTAHELWHRLSDFTENHLTDDVTCIAINFTDMEG